MTAATAALLLLSTLLFLLSSWHLLTTELWPGEESSARTGTDCCAACWGCAVDIDEVKAGHNNKVGTTILEAQRTDSSKQYIFIKEEEEEIGKRLVLTGIRKKSRTPCTKQREQQHTTYTPTAPTPSTTPQDHRLGDKSWFTSSMISSVICPSIMMNECYLTVNVPRVQPVFLFLKEAFYYPWLFFALLVWGVWVSPLRPFNFFLVDTNRYVYTSTRAHNMLWWFCTTQRHNNNSRTLCDTNEKHYEVRFSRFCLLLSPESYTTHNKEEARAHVTYAGTYVYNT